MLTFKPMIRRMFSEIGAEVSERDSIRIAREILKRKPDSLKVADVRMKWKLAGISTAKAIAAALDDLADHGWLIITELKTGGRPAKSYTVNPRVYGVG
jgi:DNA-binding NtrC family response regulator